MRTSSVLILAVLSSACAQTPPVTTNYYLAKTAVHVRVTRTLGCDALDRPVIASTPEVTIVHSADPNALETLELWRVDSQFANSELKTEYTVDGRLKTINASTTGQGETILKTAIKLAEIAADDGGRGPAIKLACQNLKEAFKDKPVTVIFDTWDQLSLGRPTVAVPPDAQSAEFYAQYRVLLGDTCLRLDQNPTTRKPATFTAGGDDVLVHARQPAIMEAAVAIGPPSACGQSNIWTGNIPVAQLGQRYDLPIPKAALFGKQVFGVTFDESGALTMLQYNKDTGAPGMLNVVQAGAEAVQTTAAEEAAALKSEADLIAAQQRLVRCRTNPATC